MSVNRAREIAKENGYSWQQIRQMYRELRTLARESLQPLWETRQRVWEMYSSPGCWPFWRHGMQRRYAHEFGEGDWVTIPGWDETADELKRDAQELFEEIRQPHSCLPTTDDTWAEVVEILERSLE